MCFCERCVADKTQPQWVDSSPHPRGAFAWNVTRALHLAGRCVDCGECERACPVDIPLMVLKRRLAKDIHELFDYRAGTDPQAKPPLLSFKVEEDKINERGW